MVRSMQPEANKTQKVKKRKAIAGSDFRRNLYLVHTKKHCKQKW